MDALMERLRKASAEIQEEGIKEAESQEDSEEKTEETEENEETALTVAGRMAKELDEFSKDSDVDANRLVLMQKLQDVFISKRFESMQKAEDLKNKVMDELSERLPEMSPQALIRVVDSMKDMGMEEFLTVLTGKAPSKGQIQINQKFSNDKSISIGTPSQVFKGKGRTDETGGIVSPPKDIFGVLEALSVITTSITREDVEGDVIDAETIEDEET